MYYIEPINKDLFNSALRVLKEVEPTVTTDLRNKLKSQLADDASQLANAMPVTPPLSGLGKSPGYRQPKAKVSFTPGGKGNRLVSINLDAGINGRGFYIAELAGTRMQNLSRRGMALIRNLNDKRMIRGRGGRYAWPQFLMMRPEIYKKAEKVIQDTLSDLEKKIN